MTALAVRGPRATEETDLPAAGSRAAAVVTAAQARRSAFGVVLVLSVLPLQWQAVVVTPAGAVRYFHIASLLMIVIARPAWHAMSQVVGQLRPLIAGMLMFIVVGAGLGGVWGGAVDFVQTGLYCAVGLVAGGCIWTALHHESGRRLLRWSSAVTVVVFLTSFSGALRSAGISPIATFQQAFAEGNPQLLEFGLYRAAFATTSEEARTNTRHEIFASLIVTLGVTLLAVANTRVQRALLISSGIVTTALVFVSQSRSVTLALGIAGVVAVIRVLAHNRIPILLFMGFLVALAAAPVALPKLLPLFIARFSETGSYEGRIEALSLSAREVLPRLAFGGPPLDVSTHTTIGDASLRGGIVCGLGAVLVVVAFARAFVRCTSRYYRTASLPAFAGVMTMSLVLVRSFTAGSGQLHQNEWIGLGAVGAMLALYPTGILDRVATPAADEASDAGSDPLRADVS